MKFSFKIKLLLNKYKNIIIKFFFMSHQLDGVYIFLSTLVQDLFHIINFWIDFFKSFFIKGKRSLRWLELCFFLMFPFLHFTGCGLFIYKYIFKWIFLICDIFILYLLMDIRNLLNFILNYFINQIPLWYNNGDYFKILKKKSPKIYNFFFKNKVIYFLDSLISLYLIVKKYIYLILFDSLFIYIPLFINKTEIFINKYITWNYCWYLICAVQNRLDLFLYTKFIEMENEMPVWRYRFRKYLRIPRRIYRNMIYYWDENGILFTSKLGWRRNFLVIKYFGPLKIRLYWIDFKIIVFEIFHIIAYPFFGIYHKFFFYRWQIWYYKLKLDFCLYGFNFFLYPSSFKFFLVILFYPILYCIVSFWLLLKWIYNFIKKLIKKILYLPINILIIIKDNIFLLYQGCQIGIFALKVIYVRSGRSYWLFLKNLYLFFRDK